jgi:asparagine synthase (glutamine-hydrolysing)
VNGEITRYADIAHVESHFDADIETLCEGIRTRLIAGVEKRLDADAPLGFS